MYSFYIDVITGLFDTEQIGRMLAPDLGRKHLMDFDINNY